MRFGVCAPVENLPDLAQAGFDYIEPAVSTTLSPERPEGEVMLSLLARLDGAALRPEAWNLMLPGDLKVVGESADEARQIRYLAAAFRRVAALGGHIVVFGSGGARNIPDGFPRGAALEQLKGFLRRAGEAAAMSGVMVVIEPLNRGECNVINGVDEALSLAHAVAHPAVGVLSDLYHVAVEGQSYEETRQAGPLLRHVHVAGGTGRRAPISEDVPLLTGYFRALKEGSYDGRISIEGQWEDLPAQAGAALAVLREAWAAA